MNFNCDKCQKAYTIADEKVAGRSFRVTCKQCGHVIQVKASGPAPTAVAPALALHQVVLQQAGAEVGWATVRLADGAVVGPFAPSQMILALIFAAFFEWITFSFAAGISTSHGWKIASSSFSKRACTPSITGT